MDLSSDSFAWIAEVTAESSAPLTCMFTVFGKRVLHAGATVFQRHGPGLLDGAQDLRGARGSGPLADGLAAEPLVGGEVRE